MFACKPDIVTLHSILIGQVVGKESTIIGDGYEDCDSIHADHVGMAKFSNASEAGYKKILHVIGQLINKIIFSSEAKT